MTSLTKILAFCAILAATPVYAGTLAASTNSIPAYTGTSIFDNTGLGGQLDGEIEFAVFTKAGFTAEFGGGTGFTPNASDNFVYAYQVFNNGPGADFITAQISAPVSIGAQGVIGSFEEDAADILPGLNAFVGASAQWIFTDPIEGSIDNGEESAILVYSSPFSPTGGFLVTINGGTSDTTSGPVPGVLIPEPASAAIATLLVGIVACSRRRSA